MTNEEKAREVANQFVEISVGAGAFGRAISMAEWKDQQFKEYLEKKRIQKSLGCPMEEYGTGFKDGIDYILEEIINELFKEE